MNMPVAVLPASAGQLATSTDSWSKITPFLEEQSSWLWFDRAVPLVRCRFNTAVYRDSLYEQLEIPLPQPLRHAMVKRRAEFLAGRYCATRALQNLNLHDVAIAIGEHCSPVWPKGFTGSISHSNGEAVAMVMHQDNIGRRSAKRLPSLGIDIEKIASPEAAANIDRYALAAEERALVARTGMSRQLALTLVFSAKESFFKAAYPIVGRHFDFDAVAVTHIDQPLQSLKLRIIRPLHEHLAVGREVEASCQMLAADRIMTHVVVD